ncbi:hybrid non-ribosomal peptide synthetase/type I polyketide synthase [Actinokineospora terrae]|uniref:Amino acid adenylation domain-containing protein/natural product biosynthesis luciferase-like monooxygenase domain-containing protein n=1 Tax=Actinokineospora terrae TaxID=155974 RepID=A0A1H9X982_9PSEU|nr:hybrid non-ribosomal peptide synthetase/type I polyketide synthase [Actinokineospora terrae]SES42437.1 amino acid adenylation domain-containing protein/natural product biosynthesis luciferase-like monooxygenase domain-containing protein [Actinokineospora terrae]
MTGPSDRRIAIIGMAARFPGADTLDRYWQNLLSGVVSTRRSTRDELLAEGFSPSTVDDPGFVPVTGALDDIAGFDAALFGISPAEAAVLDPQHRLFLQICHEAMEHGGYTGAAGRVGVYAGSGMNLYSLRSYLRARLADTDADDQLTALRVVIGNEPDFLPSRVSYRLGLTGPAMSVRAACSTSLVAVHTAISALLAGDADLALAGAAALHVPRLAGYTYQDGSILSRSGECRPFDADADGTVGGNGVAAVLLKPLAAALADGDTVHAVILGSAVNNDGSAKMSYTAPGLTGQIDVLRAALATADVDPASIGYIEAHGTGTALGDPIEVDALREVYGDRRDPLALGSVKANIGHLDSCAGMSGLIKAVLALRHGTVPPLANLRTPSPALGLGDGPIVLPTQARSWPVAGIRRAAVTALGVGGTNAHVILEQAPEAPEPGEPAPWVVPLSAHDETALARLAERMADVVGTTHPADVLTTLGAGRRRYRHRSVSWGDDVAEVLRAGGSVTGAATDPGKVVFAFAGQGLDCTGAARSLMGYPAAALVLRRCAEQHRRASGTDILGPLLADTHSWTTAELQPALLALQLAQVALLAHLGVRPDLVVGHSAGEYAALCVAGALSERDAMRLAGARGIALQGVADGGLLAVFGEVGALPGLEIAVRNGPSHNVFGGPTEAVEAAAEELTVRGVDWARVPGDRAFHTGMVEPALGELVRQASQLDWRPLRLPLVTGVGGALLAPGTALGADHVRDQTRASADYRASVDRLVAGGVRTFVELGPSGALTALGRQWPTTTWLPLVRRGADSVVPGLAGMFCHGVEVDWAALHPGRRVPLPTYPFTLVRHWAEPAVEEVTVSDSEVQVHEVVLRKVRELAAHYLGDKPDRVGADVAFVDMGADSLLMVNMARDLHTTFGVRVPMRDLFADADTPDKLTTTIVARMPAAQRDTLSPPTSPTTPITPPAPLVPAAQPVRAPTSTPVVPGSGHEGIIREQLALMDRFAQIMSHQVALLAGSPPLPTTDRIREPLADTVRQPLADRVPQPAASAVPQRSADTVARSTTNAVRHLAAEATRQPVVAQATPPAHPAATTTPDFSLYFFGDYPHDTTGDKYAAILAAARFADETGMHAVWLPERHFDSFGGVFPNPSVLAAAIAAQTERVRIHSGSVVLPLHDPIRVAEEWSVVDNLSGGRVSLGVAPGWHARDFVLAPGVYGRHREAMYEHVETIKALWRGEAVTRTAGNGEPVEVRLFPRPVQQEPDFYTAILGNPDSYRLAAARGLGVITNLMSQGVDELAGNIALYRAARAEHGLDPAAGRVVVLLHTFLGADTERTRAAAFGPFCAYLRSSLSLFSQVTNSLGFSIDLDTTPADDLDFLLTRAYDRYCADRALIGSPADVEPIARRLAALGVDEIACFVDFGVPPDQVTAALPAISLLRSAFAGEQAAGGEQVAAGEEMTTAERQIWYLEQAFPGRPTHNETIVVRLDGALEVSALRSAVAAVVDRHPALRSVFREVGGEPRRVVSRSRAVGLPVVDDLGADPRQAAVRIAAEETARPFDLARGPLFEPWLVRLGDHRHLLVLRMHHLVIDTWSAGILSEEIAACYRAAVAGGTPELPEPGARRTSTAVSAESLAYWTDLLADAPTELALPIDRPRTARPTGRGATTPVELDAATTKAVRDLARRVRATPFMVVLAAFAVALRKLSGQTDIVVGTPMAHRPEGTERTVGFFVHTLPLRLGVPDNATFTDLVLAVREQVLGAQEHQEVPLPDIVRALGGPADPLRNPLFDVVVRINNEAPFELDLPGVDATLADAAVDRAVTDLALLLTTTGDTIRGKLNFSVDLFDAVTAERVASTFLAAVTAGVSEPDQVLGELITLTGDEAGELAAWQDGGPRVAPPSALHAGVSEVDGVAVVDDSGELTRAELFARAAAITAAVGTGPEPIGIHLPRSGDAVAAQLGVARAGRAFVPLDPAQPPARLALMIAQAGVTTVVTRSASTAPEGVSLVLVDDLPAPTDAVVLPAPDEVAYVLFTSGSTGAPKGCVVEHRAIANTIDWLCRDLGLTAEDRLAWVCAPGFDISLTEVWPALRSGATLHVAPSELRLDPVGLRDWMVRVGITMTFVPTPVGELLLELSWPEGSLRHLLTGGDRLRRRPAPSLPFTVWNVYGPTEAAVASTWTRVSPSGDGPPSIGGPVPGTWVRVLDAAGRQVPVGVAGELYLGGAQLARGYVSAQETAARFVDHPVHGRLYRTGDIVRWRSDGELDFLHRNDSQVQIRGYRVEPGEVEHQLRALPGVREAAVRVLDDVSLAAYVVTAESTASLRATLAARLPDYMVPSAWMVLPALPLTSSGKLDRAALPSISTAPEVAAPLGEVERRLHEVWCAELGLAAVSVTATFFELGGHSLSAIRMVNRLRAEFGPALGVLDFLRTPTIRGLAALLEPPVEVERTGPASTGQLHGYRLTRASTVPNVLTIAMRFALRGEVDREALVGALTALVARHPALRTRYRLEGDSLRQEVMAQRPITLPVVPVTAGTLDDAVAEWAARGFDLDAEPAFRPVLFTVSPTVGELLLAMHHSFSDGWSMAVLIRDLGELYRGLVVGTSPVLREVTTDYLDFTLWEQSYLAQQSTRDLVAGWAARNAGAQPLLLPTDRPRGEVLTGVGASIVTSLSPELTARATAAAADRGTTPFAVLLAAFVALGHELTGADVIAPHSSAANRPDERFEDVVGVFTHTTWLMVPVAGALSFNDLIGRATEALWERLNLQSVPAVVLNEALGFAARPPRVLFGLYNSPLPDLELTGLSPAHPVDVTFPVARAEQGWALSPTADGGLSLYVEYSTDLYDAETVRAWTERFRALLDRGLSTPGSRTWDGGPA